MIVSVRNLFKGNVFSCANLASVRIQVCFAINLWSLLVLMNDSFPLHVGEVDRIADNLCDYACVMLDLGEVFPHVVEFINCC